MKFVDFELTEYVKDYKYFEEYLEIRYKQDNVKRSVILKEADIYQSAFSLAKKDGLGTHKKIVQKFEKYYGLEKIDKFVLEQLNTHFNNMFIGIYYANKELTESSYQDIMGMRSLFEKTYISFLFDFFELFYLVNSNNSGAVSSKLIISEFYCKLKKYYSIFTPKLLILFILFSFSTDCLSIPEVNKEIAKLEELLVNHPKLKGYSYFRIAFVYHRSGQHNASIHYLKESLTYLVQDINLQRAKSVQSNLFTLYIAIGTLAKAKEQGETFLLYLNTVDGDEFLKWSINYNMALISIQLENYKEALHYIETAYQYNNNKIAMIALYMHICHTLKDNKKVKELYFTNQELINTTTKIIYKQTIELIYHKTIKYSRALRNKEWKDLNQLLQESNNYNVTRYIHKLK